MEETRDNEEGKGKREEEEQNESSRFNSIPTHVSLLAELVRLRVELNWN